MIRFLRCDHRNKSKTFSEQRHTIDTLSEEEKN